jgi:hypothetical protein
MENIEKFRQSLINFCQNTLKPGTAESVQWIGILLLISALIPSFLAVMAGVTDKLPPVDLVLFIWAALIAFFIRATIMKDMVNIITIGLGFVVNSIFMALILFK